MSGRTANHSFLPQQQQLMPAIAVIEVIAVCAVVATTETMPTIAAQHAHPHGWPGTCGGPPGPGPAGEGACGGK